MTLLDMQGMAYDNRRNDNSEDSNVSIGCDADSGLSVLCGD
jgi:hypothetical protein